MRTSAPDAVAVPPCAVAIVRTIVNPSPAPPRRGSDPAAGAIECMREELGREARAMVADEQGDETVAGASRERHGARSMAQRVVDKIAECLLESNPVAGQHQIDWRLELERASLALRAPGETVAHAA